MNFDKESKSRKKKKDFFLCVCVCWGGGGGGSSYGRYEHEGCDILYTLHIVITSSTKPFSFMKIILTVFKIESYYPNDPDFTGLKLFSCSVL